MVAKEEEDAQKGYDEPDGFHVLPVHGQLDLGWTGMKRVSWPEPTPSSTKWEQEVGATSR